MEGIINEINKSYPNVTSVIFVFSEYPSIQHSENDITVPRIISFIENSDAEKFKSLATPDFQGTVSHFYINYCWFIKPLRYYYFAFISVSHMYALSSLFQLWAVLSLLYFLWTWCVMKQHAMGLQRFLMIFSLYYVLNQPIQLLGLYNCPDQSEALRYLDIVQIALTTIFNTLLIACLFLISKVYY